MRVRVCKLRLRLGLVDGYVVERGFIGAISVGTKWLRKHGLHPDVRGVAFPANEAHEAPVTLVNGAKAPTSPSKHQ